jgi:hypothetical protein
MQNMNKPTIKHISNLALGSDSQLELVSINNHNYILKTYLGPDALIKKNREQLFHQELDRLGLACFKFYYPELITEVQICIEYIEDLKLLVDVTDIQYFIALAKFLTKLHNNSQSKQDYELYYDWLKSEIINSKAETKYIDLALKLIDNLKAKGSNLTLIHSDFHDNNIGIISDNHILLFDSGHCPYIFGHHYHDLSRLTLYYPDKIIFENEKIWPRMVHIHQSIKDKKLFLEFCYIQSLLVYNNQWVKRAREVTEYLFHKLI